MALKAKRLIVSVVSLSLLINILSAVYIVQIKNNQEALNKSYQNKISELEDDAEFYRNQYHKYYELCEELENQMGVYYDY